MKHPRRPRKPKNSTELVWHYDGRGRYWSKPALKPGDRIVVASMGADNPEIRGEFLGLTSHVYAVVRPDNDELLRLFHPSQIQDVIRESP